MKKKIIIGLLVLGIFVIVIANAPSIILKIEVQRIKNEVNLVNNKIKKGNTYKKSDLEKNITLKNRELENNVEEYLSEVISVTSGINSIKGGNELNDLLNINNLDNIDNIINNINVIKDKLNNLNNELDKIENDKNNEKYNNLVSVIDLNKYKSYVSNKLVEIDKDLEVLNYLKNNNNYKVEENKIIFLKRNEYDGYTKLVNEIDKINLYNYDLISDNDGPIIRADSMTIYEGVGIDLKSKFSCEDLVDGIVECEISGSYDKNNIGIYPIKISAIDKSGHKSEKSINISVIEKTKLKYYTEIIRNQNTVIVYELDENKEYTKIARVFPCSTGRNGRTPTGIFYSTKGSNWGSLMGGVWGQYYTVITGSILFHSVPYYTKSKDNLEWEEYNKLGNFASAGCVRVAVIDAKWLFDNCPSGMKIKIYDGELPAGVSKPVALKIDGNSPYRGWDPTDPDPNNPWKQENSN